MSKGKKDGGRGNERGRGDTVLHIACSNGNTALVELLLPRGADIEAHSDCDGMTPLMRAAEMDHPECARLLLENGASVTALDKKGHTALHWARLHSKGAEKLLLERGAKPCAWNCAKCKRRRDEPPAGSGGGGSSGGGSVSNGSGSGSSHSGGRGGGGALADPPAKQGIAATRPKQPVTPPVDRSRLDKVELDRLDVAQAKQIVARDPDNPNWIAFTCAEAQWVPLSVDAEMSQHFAAREAVIETAKAQGNDEKIVEEWVGKAEQYLHTWVVRGILTSEKRAAHFRALGRGWVFIQLSSQRSSSGGHWTSGAPSPPLTPPQPQAQGVVVHALPVQAILSPPPCGHPPQSSRHRRSPHPCAPILPHPHQLRLVRAPRSQRHEAADHAIQVVV